MSTLRKVPLKLGLVSVTVGVQSAIDAGAQPSFNTVCDKGHDPARVKQSLTCPTCSNADRGTFKKAQATDDGKYVIVDPSKLEEVAECPPEVKDAINLTAHPADDLRFAIPGGKVYYLAPVKGEHDTYALMVDLVSKRDDVALCAKFAIRSKPAMYQLGVHEGALTLLEIAWPADVKDAPQHTGNLDASMAEMAAKFLDSIIEPFDADTYVDVRAEAVAEFMAKQKAVKAGDAEKVTTSSPDDLMAAMAAAVGEKAPAKKKTAKKATKKKAASKKAG